MPDRPLFNVQALAARMRRAAGQKRAEVEPLAAWLEQRGKICALSQATAASGPDQPAFAPLMPDGFDPATSLAVCPFDALPVCVTQDMVLRDRADGRMTFLQPFLLVGRLPDFWQGLGLIHAVHAAKSCPWPSGTTVAERVYVETSQKLLKAANAFTRGVFASHFLFDPIEEAERRFPHRHERWMPFVAEQCRKHLPQAPWHDGAAALVAQLATDNADVTAVMHR